MIAIAIPPSEILMFNDEHRINCTSFAVAVRWYNRCVLERGSFIKLSSYPGEFQYDYMRNYWMMKVTDSERKKVQDNSF